MNGKKSILLIIAHPDDETLWVGGTLLNHPEWQCTIICLCRKYDVDRAPKFYKTLDYFHAKGTMGDLDDGPEQQPQNKKDIEHIVTKLLPNTSYDIIITHNPLGEYTRHLRHEEIGTAVMDLWIQNKLQSKELWIFAYEDNNGKDFPKAIKNAAVYFTLTPELWKQKKEIITNIYGFSIASWEAKVIPKAEAFWRFIEKKGAGKWLQEKQVL